MTRKREHLTCTIPNCTYPHRALGLCSRHYDQRRRERFMADPELQRAKLIQRREELGMNHREVAELSFMSRPSYSLIEYGTYNVDDDKMTRINAAFEQRRQELIEQHRESIRKLEAMRPLTWEDFEYVEEGLE